MKKSMRNSYSSWYLYRTYNQDKVLSLVKIANTNLGDSGLPGGSTKELQQRRNSLTSFWLSLVFPKVKVTSGNCEARNIKVKLGVSDTNIFTIKFGESICILQEIIS